MKIIEKFKARSIAAGYQILRIDRVRNIYCKLRYLKLRGNISIMEGSHDLVGHETLPHNMDALKNPASFGMSNRMALLLYPLAAIFRNYKKAKILIVGPRTEDDIFWARSLGMQEAMGFDLFSYSSLVYVGDIHQTVFKDDEFDAVILGWVISYSNSPAVMIEECSRIVKSGGYIGFGIESNPEHRRTGIYSPPRANGLNSGNEIAQMSKLPIIFIHDPVEDVPTDNAVILINMK